jgi:hypothetical protein
MPPKGPAHRPAVGVGMHLSIGVCLCGRMFIESDRAVVEKKLGQHIQGRNGQDHDIATVTPLSVETTPTPARDTHGLTSPTLQGTVNVYMAFCRCGEVFSNTDRKRAEQALADHLREPGEG